MKFLIDVCAGRRLADWLLAKGYEVISVADTDKKMPDEKILEWGAKDSLVIVTMDKDFSELTLFQLKNCYSLIRLQNLPVEQRIKKLAKILELHFKDLESGAIIIQRKSKLRVIKITS